MSLMGLVSLDESEDLFSINSISALVNNSIADLSNQYNKTRWSVVVWRVGPNHEDNVHGGHKQIWNLQELLPHIGQLEEKFLQSTKVLEILGGFLPGRVNILLQLAEGSCVSRFVLL